MNPSTLGFIHFLFHLQLNNSQGHICIYIFKDITSFQIKFYLTFVSRMINKIINHFGSLMFEPLNGHNLCLRSLIWKYNLTLTIYFSRPFLQLKKD